MKANQDQVLGWVADLEGGYVNDPRDNGGATNHGVTQGTFNAWNARRKQKRRDVKDLTKEEARRIFIAEYFAPVRFDELPSGLDYAMADYSIHSGPHQATKDLQRALVRKGHTINVDGKFGPVTMASVKAEPDVRGLIGGLIDQRMTLLQNHPDWVHYENGWTKRIEFVHHTALQMAEGKPDVPAINKDPIAALINAIVGIITAFINSLKGGK